MSFMLEIDATRPPPLEQLAVDYALLQRAPHPSIEFCRRAAGVPENDEIVAKRLRVAVSTIRGWREVGRRATPTMWSRR